MLLLLRTSKLLLYTTTHHHGGRATPFLHSAFLPQFSRLLSSSLLPPPPPADSTNTQNSLTQRQLLEQYLVDSCGFSRPQAVGAAKQIPCCTPFSNTKLVIQFLEMIGMDDGEIRTAVLRDPRLLVLDVEEALRPKVTALGELGFDDSDVRRLFCLYPSAFGCGAMEQRIGFWVPVVGSVEKLFGLLKKNRNVLAADLEKVVVPNLHVFQKKCALSGTQIVEMSASRLLTENPENVKEIVKKAMQFSVPTASPHFGPILLACAQKARNFKSKIEALTSSGLSEVEVLSMVGRQPGVLRFSAESLRRKANFLTKEVGIDPSNIARNPLFMLLSMQKRLVPRHHVMMKLKDACLPDGKKSFYCAASLSEQQFLDKFIFPNLETVPDLYSTYAAIAGAGVLPERSLNDHSELLRALEFSESEVSKIITKKPDLVTKSEQIQARVNFLLTHVGLDRSYIANHPKILTFSLERRLIPRYYVMKCLELKGLVRIKSIMNFIDLKEKHFVEQFISPYEHIIQGLAENYGSACAGRTLKCKHNDQEAQSQSFS